MWWNHSLHPSFPKKCQLWSALLRNNWIRNLKTRYNKSKEIQQLKTNQENVIKGWWRRRSTWIIMCRYAIQNRVGKRDRNLWKEQHRIRIAIEIYLTLTTSIRIVSVQLPWDLHGRAANRHRTAVLLVFANPHPWISDFRIMIPISTVW